MTKTQSLEGHEAGRSASSRGWHGDHSIPKPGLAPKHPCFSSLFSYLCLLHLALLTTPLDLLHDTQE